MSMGWPLLTEQLIAAFVCQPDKSQSIYWDGACPGLGVRVTPSGFKAFVFDSRVRRGERDEKLRITIGDVRSWSIGEARDKARYFKRMTDQGTDPRDTLTRKRP